MLERTGARKDERIDALHRRLGEMDAENAALRLELAQAALAQSGASFGALGRARGVRAETRLHEARARSRVLSQPPHGRHYSGVLPSRSASIGTESRRAPARASQRVASAAELTPLERFVASVLDGTEVEDPGSRAEVLRRADVDAQLQATVELLDKSKLSGRAARRS